MFMKHRLGLVLVWMCGATGTFAQLDEAVEVANPEAVQIMGTEAVNIQQTIRGYIQGAKRRGRLELYDRKKGNNVILRLDRIVLDDPARVVFLQPTQVAVCGECTEIASRKDERGEVQEQGIGDKYEVWFLVQRGKTYTSKVLDTIIKSVNGQPMYEWTQAPDGQWSATVVPDAQ